MGCNLLRHAYNHFDTHEAQHDDTNIQSPYWYIAISICITDPYSVLVPCMCTHVHAYVCVPVWIRLCICIYTQVSSSLLEYVKIYHRSRTLNKHSSLAIFDKHLLKLTNQGLPKILPQYPLETALTVTWIWRLKNNSPNSQLKLQIHYLYSWYFISAYHTFISKTFSTWQYLFTL